MSTKYRVIVARDAVLVNSNSGFSQLPKSLLLKKTGRDNRISRVGFGRRQKREKRHGRDYK